MWRHRRDPRPVSGPRLLLLAPEPIDDPPERWLGPELRRTGFVYGDHALLWRSARILSQEGCIETPDGIRKLVETAYDQEAPNPPGLARATSRAKGEWLAARGIAWQNLLELDKPYQRDAGLWDPDVRTPTRLGEPQKTFRLARIDDKRVVPWYSDEDPHRAWALSEVSVRATRLVRAIEDQLVNAAKQEWPTWDRDIPVLLMQPDRVGRWVGTGVDPQGRERPVTYEKLCGLMIGT